MQCDTTLMTQLNECDTTILDNDKNFWTLTVSLVVHVVKLIWCWTGGVNGGPGLISATSEGGGGPLFWHSVGFWRIRASNETSLRRRTAPDEAALPIRTDRVVFSGIPCARSTFSRSGRFKYWWRPLISFISTMLVAFGWISITDWSEEALETSWLSASSPVFDDNFIRWRVFWWFIMQPVVGGVWGTTRCVCIFLHWGGGGVEGLGWSPLAASRSLDTRWACCLSAGTGVIGTSWLSVLNCLISTLSLWSSVLIDSSTRLLKADSSTCDVAGTYCARVLSCRTSVGVYFACEQEAKT